LRAWCHFAVRQNGEQKISLSEGRLAGAAERLFSGPTGPKRRATGKNEQNFHAEENFASPKPTGLDSAKYPKL